MIDARMKPAQRGSLAHCGHCGAPLGLAKAPQAKGLRVDVVMAKIAAEEGGYAGPDQTRDWTIEPPQSKEQSAVPGFARTGENGHEVYRLIKPFGPSGAAPGALTQARLVM